MYKDKDKQREADKERQRRHRERIGYVRAGYKPSSELGVNKGVTEGVTEQGVTKGVTETHDVPVSDQPTKVYPLSIHKPERTALGNIRVSKPGDDDYVPQCETTRVFVEGVTQGVTAQTIMDTKREIELRSPLTNKPKRGKDIKCFKDLPPDVQATINRLSQSNEEKQKRTKAAIKYQHLFPDRFHTTGYAGSGPLSQTQIAEIGEAR